MLNKSIFSSKKMDWETPQDFFDELDKEFKFTLDVCANSENSKKGSYFTIEEDGLKQDWTSDTCWMNPPYGRGIGLWVKKASESRAVVALLPARTDTRWFHDYIYNKPNTEIRFIKGRLKFVGAKSSAPFPSMIIIFK